jgi:hypothetical protein
MAYLTLITGLLISTVAIFYSVAGLTSIFSAAPLAIIVMGTVLEVSKLVATVWLKQNWEVAPKLLKGYLLSAVAILMFITSMGIFGFLSKAHSDQTLVSGDVQSKIAVYDEKIKTEKDNIEAARKALVQMDAAVDQTMARSTNEAGANRATQLRRTQAKERAQLQKEITDAQKRISTLNDERAPIAAEVRKVEAEVGPIKYIAAFIYGDNPDANLLEKAVTWVIILIVVVFDPLAVMLLLASQYSFALLRTKKEEPEEEEPEEEFFDHARDVAKSIDDSTYVSTIYPPTGPITSWTTTTYEPDDGALTDEQIDLIRKIAKDDLPTGEVVTKDSLFPEEEFPFRNKGIQPGMPLTASYVQPKVEEPIEESVIEEPAVEETQTTVTHNADSMIIEDTAGIQEIPTHNLVDLKNLIDQYGYSIENGVAKVHGIEIPESLLASLLDAGYVQNEEQKESDQWSKILNKTITEEEYLKAVQKKKDA